MESLSPGDDAIIAWWYSGFYENRKDVSQPHVFVLFRKISEGMLSDEVIQRRLPLVALGQTRIRKGVGYASIHARPVFESNGTLRECGTP